MSKPSALWLELSLTLFRGQDTIESNFTIE
jgi:hypothetical protein